MNEKKIYRIGAILAILSAIATIVAGYLHPSSGDPTNHIMAFNEYAADEHWVFSHLIQTFGFFFLFLTLIALAYPLRDQNGSEKIISYFGLPMAFAGIAVAAVLQGIDGIALKILVDKWVSVPDSEKSTVFIAAETVRYLEVSFNSMFRIIQGVSILLFGSVLGLIKGWVKWVGWLGIVIGIAIVARGFAVAFTGFSLSNPFYSPIGELAVYLLNLWLVLVGIYMWHKSRKLSY